MIQKNIQLLTAVALLTLNLNIFGMHQLGRSSISAPNNLGNVFLMHVNNNYFVIHNGTKHAVQNAWVDPNLRNLNTLQVASYLKKGNLINISQANDGSFSLQGHVRVRGGGAGGATVGFWGGKLAVYAVGHGAIALIAGGVGLVSGPAGYVVGQALESTFAAPIEILSNTVAVGTSIALATITGPV